MILPVKSPITSRVLLDFSNRYGAFVVSGGRLECRFAGDFLCPNLSVFGNNETFTAA